MSGFSGMRTRQGPVRRCGHGLAGLAWAAILLGAAAAAQDPWPEYQRTASRLGRTDTIGPQTPTIAWSLRADPRPDTGALYSASAVMDAKGRIFVGHTQGIAVVDAATHELLRQIEDFEGVYSTPSLWNGRLLYGTTGDVFYCVDTETWEEVWSEPAAPHPNVGNVVDERCVVYYPSQQDVLYARWVVDGSEVWTHHHYDGFYSAPTLDPDGLKQLYIGGIAYAEWLAFRTADGGIEWTSPLGGYIQDVSPVENGRLYTAKAQAIHSKLFCLDAETGEEIWSFPTEVTTSGDAAIRDDGVIYVNASNGSTGWLFAVASNGHELWRYPITNQALNRAPMIDGAGTAYFCTYKGQTGGWIHAVQADGAGLWVKQMPDKVAGTPMLAPDGTLYVMCKDKYLYALRDPPGDLDFDGDIDFDDFTSFETCTTGPREPGTAALTAPGCELLDFDSDWDVDLADVAHFQLAFTGD